MFARAALVALMLSYAAPLYADGTRRVAWDDGWPRFRPWEHALTAGLVLNIAQAVLLYPPPKTNWEGGILFDDAVRSAFVLNSTAARRDTAAVSDTIYYFMATYPLLVDTAAITAGVHRAPDVALQMTLINLQSYALTGAVSLAASQVGRARPLAIECKSNPGYDGKCGDAPTLDVSFPSGHTAIAFTGAGLMCAHHAHLPLYGGVADPIACATGMTAAATASVLRIASDNHYATDVILGAGLGIFSGYVLPSILHYGFGAERRAPPTLLPHFTAGHGDHAVTSVFLPRVDVHGIGITAVIAFGRSR